MIRKRIWITGDSLPSFTNHLQGGSGSLSAQLVDDYIRLSFANPNPYLYVDMSSTTDYVIQSGDYLEYDIYWETAGAILIAMDFTCSDASEFRDSGAVDQNSLSVHPSTDISARCSGTWYHRKIPFTTFTGGSSIGKTVQYFDIACEINGASTYVGRIRNIAITDGNGTNMIGKIAGKEETAIRKVGRIGPTPEVYKTPFTEWTSLVSYYRFEGNANDYKGVNNGTSNNITYSLIDGKYGQGAYMNGSNGYISIPTNNFPTTNVTLSFWAYPTTSSVNNSIIDSNSDDGANRCNIHFPWSNGYIYWDWGDLNNGGRLSVAWNAAWLNTLGYYTFVAKSGTGMAIYRNGSSIASNSTTSTFNPTGKTIEIGRYVGTTYWTGRIDDFAIFNVGFTASDVETLYRIKLKKLMGITNI